MEPGVSQGITLSNTESIPGKRIVAFHGVVTGNTVRAKHIGRDFMAGLKNIVGGELKGYTELLQDSRKEATDRAIDAGAAAESVEIIEVEEIPLAYLPGAACRVRVKAVGPVE